MLVSEKRHIALTRHALTRHRIFKTQVRQDFPVERRPDESLMPDEFPGLEPDVSTSATPALSPSVSPRGGGVMATWEF